MHSWDVMPTNNFDHNWYGGLQIKSEAHDIMSAYQTSNMESSPATSPQSTAEPDGIFYDGGSTNLQRPLGFNPLTPPGYPGAVLSQSYQKHLQTGRGGVVFTKNEPTFQVQTTLTPSHTPPMDVTPPKSPKTKDDTPEKDIESISDNFMDSGDETRSMESDYDDEGIKLPKVNSHGKVKKYKCKQCDYIAVTKLNFWDHTKAHIKPEKMLKCPKCPFVTEYKHHLEYHLRNHDGSKPFQCPKCNYSCVNKSMLNSHLKSHSNIYQYRCNDCNYATKYCHSLKLHLRKYSHKPAMVLNSDGTPNPLPIIDVYGTRRGPKTKASKQHQLMLDESSATSISQHHLPQHQTTPIKTENMSEDKIPTISSPSSSSSSSGNRPPLPNLMSQMIPNSLASMLHPGTNVPMFPYLNLNFHMFAVRQQQQQQQQQQHHVMSQLSPNHHNSISAIHDLSEDEKMLQQHNNNNEPKIDNSALDLSSAKETTTTMTVTPPKPCDNSESDDEEPIEGDDEDDDDVPSPFQPQPPQPPIVAAPILTTPSTLGSTTPTVNKNRRKGRAFKLDIMKDYSESDEESRPLQQPPPPPPPTEDVNIEFTAITTPTSATASTASTQTPSNLMLDHRESAPKMYECKFCDISFKDAVLHTIHMGYHGYNDVFQCNMCGEKCDDRVAFFLHIARNSHS